MGTKTVKEITEVITRIATEHDITLSTSDVKGFCKAYLKFGDIDLALNEDGEVLSDLMAPDDLDVLAKGLEEAFGQQSHQYPHKTYPVKINGKRYDTHIDTYGEQRFNGNRILHDLLPVTGEIYRQARAAYESGKYNVDEWVEFNAQISRTVKETMLTLQTSVTFENSREEIL